MEELYKSKEIPKLQTEESEELTMSQKMDKLVEMMGDKEKKKKFKMPFGVRMQKGKLKKNYAIVQLIRTNGGITFKMMKIEDDTIKIGGNFYDASADNILRYKKYPLLIIPEWNMKPVSPDSDEVKVEPFSAKDNFNEAAEKGTLTAAQKLILTKMKGESIKPKMQLSGKTFLIIGLVLVAGYFILDYFKLF